MKWKDIRDAIGKTIKNSSQRVTVYGEEVDRPQFPYLFVDLVDYKKDFHSEHKEMKSIIIDIRAHVEPDSKSYKGSIIEMLEDVDNSFDHMGKKIIQCRDENGQRSLIVKDAQMNIIDRVGHYTFTVDLFDLYGSPGIYELMEDLYVNLENK